MTFRSKLWNQAGPNGSAKKTRPGPRCRHPAGGAVLHVKECRPGRPLCAWRRRQRDGVCTCGLYPFPHRGGSGVCGNPARVVGAVELPEDDVPFDVERADVGAWFEEQAAGREPGED